MVNPVLTIIFDLVLVGGALAIASAMATEYLMCREPHVGSTRPARAARARPAYRRRAETREPGMARREAA